MTSKFDAVLMIGFGAPTTGEEIRPFLVNVTHGRNIPESRLEEVARHYEAIGGFSPYNELTFRQVDALRAHAKKYGFCLPFYLGMRNWSPYLKDELVQMKKDGVRRAIAFVLAPLRSYSSFDQYVENVEIAKTEAHFPELEVTYVDQWNENPLFIEAVTDRVNEILGNLDEKNPEETLLVFTAHSIPVTMADQCKYHDDFETSCRLVAERLERKRWIAAYQSRSGRPTDLWLEPDVNEVLRHTYQHGVRNVVVVPIGFLSDHAEVLYDLDREARQTAESAGLRFFRAETVMDHPKFIEMMYGLIDACVTTKQIL